MTVSKANLKVSENMQGIAELLETALVEIAGKNMGFSLVVFNDTPNSRLSYISNCDREKVMNALEALLKGWKEGMPDIPAHEFNG